MREFIHMGWRAALLAILAPIIYSSVKQPESIILQEMLFFSLQALQLFFRLLNPMTVGSAVFTIIVILVAQFLPVYLLAILLVAHANG